MDYTMEDTEQIQFIDLSGKINYDRFFECYSEYYHPPLWIKNPDIQDAIWHYKDETTVYYDKADNLDTVKELIYKREPTNLGTRKLYDRDSLMKYYEYEESPYKEGSPNVSIYCKALCYPSDNRSRETSDQINSEPKHISVISVIAPALDSQSQPDYKVLKADDDNFLNTYKAMLLKAFIKIGACYEDKGFTKLLMTGIGMSAFLSDAESVGITYEEAYGQYIACCMEVFQPMFKNKAEHTLIFNMTNKARPNQNVPIMSQEDCKEIAGTKGNVKLENTFIIDYINGKTQAELDKTLIVNAWDPYSVVGNGNFSDGSIDGYIGRISAISVVTWPLPEFELAITYKEVSSKSG